LSDEASNLKGENMTTYTNNLNETIVDESGFLEIRISTAGEEMISRFREPLAPKTLDFVKGFLLEKGVREEDAEISFLLSSPWGEWGGHTAIPIGSLWEYESEDAALDPDGGISWRFYPPLEGSFKGKGESPAESSVRPIIWAYLEEEGGWVRFDTYLRAKEEVNDLLCHLYGGTK
jgi:hypothetical protein